MAATFTVQEGVKSLSYSRRKEVIQKGVSFSKFVWWECFTNSLVLFIVIKQWSEDFEGWLVKDNFVDECEESRNYRFF